MMANFEIRRSTYSNILFFDFWHEDSLGLYRSLTLLRVLVSDDELPDRYSDP